MYKIEVVYTELGGPNGYGHQEVSFECKEEYAFDAAVKLQNWKKSIIHTFSPDIRDINDFLHHCVVYVSYNGSIPRRYKLRQLKVQPNLYYI